MLFVTWLENWITVTVCNCALFLSPIGPHIWFCVSTILFLLGWLYSVVWDQASGCFQHCPISLGLLGLVCFLFVCLFCASIRLQFFFNFYEEYGRNFDEDCVECKCSFQKHFTRNSCVADRPSVSPSPCCFYSWKFLEDIEIEIYSPMSSTYALNFTIYCCLSCSCFSRLWIASLDHLFTISLDFYYKNS